MYRDEEQRDFARQLRNGATTPEKNLWGCLRAEQLGVKFRRQVAIGPYVVDFACFSHRLIVELDGPQHLGPAAKQYDSRRTAWLEKQGFRVIRFRNRELDEGPWEVVETIRRELGNSGKQPNPLPSPPHKGEGAKTTGDLSRWMHPQSAPPRTNARVPAPSLRPVSPWRHVDLSATTKSARSGSLPLVGRAGEGDRCMYRDEQQRDFSHKRILELDGPQRLGPATQQYDSRRTAWLEKQGFRVIRFRNQELDWGPWEVVETIRRELGNSGKQPNPLPSPPHKGEGAKTTGDLSRWTHPQSAPPQTNARVPAPSPHYVVRKANRYGC